jgi:ComF family protein
LLKLPLNREENCFWCGQPNLLGKTCASCAADYQLDGVFVCADYTDRVIGDLIKKLKYSFARELGKTLAKIAELYLKKTLDSGRTEKINLANFTVVPIPLHKKRYNWRGFNQAEIIAGFLAAKLNLPVSTGLIRVKHRPPQAKLDGAARRENIKDCFRCSDPALAEKNILLIDDVATTGSTLNEAAGALKAAGAKKILALVIAKG